MWHADLRVLHTEATLEGDDMLVPLTVSTAALSQQPSLQDSHTTHQQGWAQMGHPIPLLLPTYVGGNLSANWLWTMLQSSFPLHWPLINSDHMRTKLAKRELERKRIEDDQRSASCTCA